MEHQANRTKERLSEFRKEWMRRHRVFKLIPAFIPWLLVTCGHPEHDDPLGGILFAIPALTMMVFAIPPGQRWRTRFITLYLLVIAGFSIRLLGDNMRDSIPMAVGLDIAVAVLNAAAFVILLLLLAKGIQCPACGDSLRSSCVIPASCSNCSRDLKDLRDNLNRKGTYAVRCLSAIIFLLFLDALCWRFAIIWLDALSVLVIVILMVLFYRLTKYPQCCPECANPLKLDARQPSSCPRCGVFLADNELVKSRTDPRFAPSITRILVTVLLGAMLLGGGLVANHIIKTWPIPKEHIARLTGISSGYGSFLTVQIQWSPSDTTKHDTAYLVFAPILDKSILDQVAMQVISTLNVPPGKGWQGSLSGGNYFFSPERQLEISSSGEGLAIASHWDKDEWYAAKIDLEKKPSEVNLSTYRASNLDQVSGRMYVEDGEKAVPVSNRIVTRKR